MQASRGAAAPAFQAIQLGGTFAYWHERNARQVATINGLEEDLRTTKGERDELAVGLAHVTKQYEHSERCLKAEQCVSRELNERLEAAVEAAKKDRAAAREANDRADKAAAAAKEETGRIANLLESREKEMQAAQDEAEKALEGKVKNEQEASDLARRIADLLNQVDSLSKRSDALESQLEAMTRQRDHHQQHSDLLLKEKNRLIDANTALKRKVAEQAQQLAAEAAATAAAAAVAVTTTPPPTKTQRGGANAARSPISVLGVTTSPQAHADTSPSPSPPPPAPMRRRTAKPRTPAAPLRPSSAGNSPQPTPAQVQAAREFAWQAAGAMEASRLGPTWIR